MENSNPHKLFGGWPFALILLASIAAYFFLKFFLFGYPPDWWERHVQRQEVFQRVQSSGGWVALKRDCDSLAEKYKDAPYGFRWWRGDTNSLPAAIAALKPKEVEFYSTSLLRQFGSENAKWYGSNAAVSIYIFGAHSTGGHDEPALGLDVVCERGVTDYPQRLRSTTPLRYWRYRKIDVDIYEYY
jgi:hypothetical protein